MRSPTRRSWPSKKTALPWAMASPVARLSSTRSATRRLLPRVISTLPVARKRSEAPPPAEYDRRPHWSHRQALGWSQAPVAPVPPRAQEGHTSRQQGRRQSPSESGGYADRERAPISGTQGHMVSAGCDAATKNICIFSGLGEDLPHEKQRARDTNGSGLGIGNGHP